MRVPERKLLAAMGGTERVVKSRISSLPGFTVVPNWSMRAAVSRAASVLRGGFSRREIIDYEASAAPR
jgi:hypothetical protein